MKFKIIFLLIITVSFNAFLHAQQIKSNKQVYRSGEPIIVDFSTISPLAEQSWIGIFKASIPRNSTTGYIQYLYTNSKTKGKFTFDPPEFIGNYELRLFDNDPKGKLITYIPIKVRVIYEDEISFSILTDEIKPAKTFEVKIENSITVNPRAWVGIFKKGHPKDNDTGYESYEYYETNKSNIVQLTAPNKTGDFELRLYSNDPGSIIKSIPFRVGELNLEGIQFAFDKEAYKPEENIVVTYTGHEELTDNAWIGLFKKDAEPNSHKGYLDYQYLKPKMNGVLNFKAPSLKGAYQVRMFYANFGPQLLAPKPFKVTSSIDKSYIKENLDTKGKVALYGIYFDTDKSIIKTESYGIIKEIADLLNENKNLKISIEGHTDNVGEKAYNKHLSEKRADAVLKLLVEKYNVSKLQLQSKGLGEIKPIADNKTSLERSKNRRVELIKI